MEYSSSRMFALTLAHRAVEDVKKDGFRQLRNYVDMCAVLANTPMQHSFFERAQEILVKTSSLYYSLISRLATSVDEDHLCTVGINLGLGGLVYGAGRQKLQAEKDGKPFSWVVTALSEDEGLEPAVTAAEAAGTYVWTLYAKSGLHGEICRLAKKHPMSVFFAVMEPADIDDACCARLQKVDNVVPVLHMAAPESTEEAFTAADRMRCARLFYGFLVEVDDDTVDVAMQAEWLDVLAQHVQICVYARKRGMAPAKAETLKENIYRSRTEPGVPLVLLDWDNDVEELNRHISPCAVRGTRIPAGVVTPINA